MIDTKENNTFVKLAKQVDSKWVLFGPHRGLNEEDRIPFELNRISNMASSSNNRAIIIVKTNNKKYFSDNTHWTLTYIQRFGNNVKLKDIPFYIVDFTSKKPLIVDYKNSVIKNDEDIQNAINSAKNIERRIKQG